MYFVQRSINTTSLGWILFAALVFILPLVGCQTESPAVEPDPAPETPTETVSPTDSLPEPDPTDTGCAPGTLGCTCLGADACEQGLVCSEGFCVEEDVKGLAVSDPRARACEVLLRADQTKVLGAVFSDEVEGTWMTQDPKTALTFVKKEDAPFFSSDIALRTNENSEGSVQILQVYCFDKQGAELKDVKVTID